MECVYFLVFLTKWHCLDNGRISMFFHGQGRDFTTLPPLPQYEPREEQMKNFAARSFPLLNIVIQVVGSRGMFLRCNKIHQAYTF